MTRKEHLEWCKKRALEYLDAGNLADAFASMASDMTKHPETAGYPAVLNQLGLLEVMGNNSAGLHRWIEGFN